MPDVYEACELANRLPGSSHQPNMVYSESEQGADLGPDSGADSGHDPGAEVCCAKLLNSSGCFKGYSPKFSAVATSVC